MVLQSSTPAGPVAEAWDKHRFEMKLVNPANKRKHRLIVVGSGLAGASAAATLSELGYPVDCFCFQIARAGRTPLRLRVGSMQPRTTRTTATRCTASFTTP